MNTLFDIPQHNKKNNEWYTPSQYIEAARAVMGGIDLDPASCELANRTVKAGRYYTKEENGLEQPWYGRVWLNPPYGRTIGYGSNILLFTEKMLHSYRDGHIDQAILLTLAKIESPWFKELWNYPLCFSDHSIRFIRNYDTPRKPGRYTTSHMQGSVFVYLGPHSQRFIEHFSPFGRIVRAIDPPPGRGAITQGQLW